MLGDRTSFFWGRVWSSLSGKQPSKCPAGPLAGGGGRGEKGRGEGGGGVSQRAVGMSMPLSRATWVRWGVFGISRDHLGYF